MFYILLIFFLTLGLSSIIMPRKAFKVFLFLLLILPTSRAFKDLSYLSGAMITDGFFIGILLVLLIKRLTKSTVKMTWKELLPLSLIILIFVVYFAYGLTIYRLDEILLRELRPIMLLIFSATFIVYVREINPEVTERQIAFFAIIAAVSNFFWFIASYLGLFSFGDAFYSSNVNRYLDISTYFSVYFVLHFMTTIKYKNSNNKNRYVIALLLSFVSILISSSRFLIISLLLALVFYHSNKITKVFKYAILSITLILIFLFISEQVGQTRVLDSFSNFGFIDQLSVRFAPAWSDIRDMTAMQRVFGYGLGHYFEIPWFEYRGLDTTSVSLDSGYLTHYTKQGVFGIILMFVITSWLIKTDEKRLKLSLLIFWQCMYFVSASFYQLVILGPLLYSAFFNMNRNNDYVPE